MTAGEFAFLGIGLVLGIGVGAAAIQVLRARAPSHQVRVTVAPNSIPTRRAATLSETTPAADDLGPARGGPGDRRNTDRVASSDDHERASFPGPTTPRRAATAGANDRTPVLAPAGIERVEIDHPAGPRIGIPITLEPDPEMDSLRAVAARREAVPAGGRAVPDRPSAASVGASEAAMNAEPGRDSGNAGGVAQGGGGGRNGFVDRPAGAGSSAPHGDETISDDPPRADPTDACADVRRVAEERCAVSVRARDGAREAVEALRTAQRTYDDHVSRAEEAAAAADPRAVRTAKEAAQQAFREARSAATTRDAVEAAARDWLAEINRINMETREAQMTAERDRAAATELASTLERLAVEADAARISAEAAEEACVAAREAVATCQEAAALDARGAAKAAAAAASPALQGSEPTTPMGSRAGEDAAIIRLLRGDRDVLMRIVATLGGDDEQERRRWQGSITGLLEALIARAIEASAFDFPTEHPFWGMFSRVQSRDITAALSSLGFRHDGFGGWVDDHVPGQRDLSLATGYAGLDPMRVRHWPTEDEMQQLLAEVTVAADEYVWEAAGGLTLGELVSLLGRRADGLTELWNDWGTVRPLLLAAD